MITQAAGLQLATPERWRAVMVISAALSLIQLFFSSAIVESPSWLNRHGFLEEKAAATRRLWTSAGQLCEHLLGTLHIVSQTSQL